MIGNLYISDWMNGRIRKVDTSGIITTVAGNGTGGFGGDGGPAVAAELADPVGVSCDGHGNLYICQYNTIKKVDSAGIITTVAGDTVGGFGGDGNLATKAQLSCPNGIAFDHLGNMYISDACNNRIRCVNKHSIINTIAGNGTQDFGGDGGLAINAEFNLPNAVAFDVFDNMYIADTWNNRVRVVLNNGYSTEITKLGKREINIYPNPTSQILNIETQNKNAEIKITNLIGKEIHAPSPAAAGSSTGEKFSFDVSSLQNGIYFVRVKTSEDLFTKKIVVQH